MNNSRQWSIQQMLLWVLVVALVFSHLSNYYQRQIVGFTDFGVNDKTLMQWIVKRDPTANAYGGGAVTGRSADACDYEIDCHITTKTVDSNGILRHLHQSFEHKAKLEGWTIIQTGDYTGRFELSLSKGVTRFRIYGWLLPAQESSMGKKFEENGMHNTRLRILQIGYIMPDRTDAG